jgi:hypothetical protein
MGKRKKYVEEFEQGIEELVSRKEREESQRRNES